MASAWVIQLWKRVFFAASPYSPFQRKPRWTSFSAELLESRVAPAVMHTNFIAYGSASQLTPAAGSGTPSGLTPSMMRHAYGADVTTFGSVAGNGTGQTIAIVDAYNQPDIVSDLAAFDTYYGLQAPASFTVLNENGGTTLPSNDSPGGWGVEISLDVEWAHVMAPNASILLVEANSASDSDLYTAVDTARNYTGVSAVSMSWSGNESSGDSSNDSHFTTPTGHNGVTFLAATGDIGAYSSSHSSSMAVGYPAVSVNVVAVGGTTLTTDAQGNYVSEAGWGHGTSSNSQGGSGGGISRYAAQPAYQVGVVTQSTTHRTVPDVSMDADPNSGVPVYDTYDQGSSTPWGQYGGTSLATPLYAGVMAVVNQGRVLNGLGTLDGPSQTLPSLYSLSANEIHDVTTGNNGYAAGTGYDLVTGRGTPIVNLLAKDLAAIKVYVESDWATLYTSGQTIPDADPLTSGNQPAVYGTTAFSSVTAALAGPDTVANETIIVINGKNASGTNVGTLNEDVVLTVAVELEPEGGSVSFNSLSDASPALASSITLNGVQLTVGADNLSTTYSGTILGTGSLDQTGTGTFTLAGTSAYTGGTTINAGSIVAGSSTALGSGTVTVNSGATLQLAGTSLNVGGLNGSGTVDNNSSSTVTLTVSATSNTTFSGLLSNTGGGALSLVVTGTGTFWLSGTASTYTGSTTISGSILQVSSLGLGGVASSIGESTNLAANLVLSGGATLDYVTASSTPSSDRSLTLGTGGGTIDVASSTSTLTFTGSISGANAFTKSGSGTLGFPTANALATGNITVSSGILAIGSITLTSSKIITINSGAVLQSSGTISTNGNTSSTYSAVTGSGTLQFTSTTNSVSSPDVYFNANENPNSTADWGSRIATAVNLGSTQRYIWGITNHGAVGVDGANSDCIISGVISGSGGITFVPQVTYGGTGAAMEVQLYLTAANTFTGPFNIVRGSLYLGNAAALASGQSVSFSPASGTNARLYLYGQNASIGNLASSGAGTSVIANSPGSTTNAATLTVNQTTSGAFGGSFEDTQAEYSNSGTPGSLGLIKNGTANLTLTGASSISGTVAVNAGSLTNNGSFTSTGGFTVASGALLNGAGNDAGTVHVAGTIQAGVGATTGILTTGALSFASGGTLAVQLNGTTAGTGYDQLAASGVNLTGATLAVTLGTGFNPAVNTVFEIISNTGSSAVTGTFSGLSQGAITMIGGVPFTISYVGGDGNDVTLTVAQAPTITSANNTTFTVGTAGSFTVTASGPPSSTFTKTGSLPSGVTLSSAGVLSGVPAAGTVGVYAITITANNGVSPNATQNFTLTVNQAPAITSAASTTFTVGTAGTFTATATGSPAPSFSETGALPSGVTLSSAGLLSGTPTTAGVYAFTLSASNGVGSAATQSFTLTVNQATTSTTVGATNVGPFSTTMPITFAATVASIPLSSVNSGTVTFYSGPGLTNPIGSPVSVSNGSASISTTLQTAGAYTITALYSGATNYVGSQGSTSAFTVNGSTTTVTLIDNGPNSSLSGQAVSFTGTVSGGAPNGDTVTLEDASNGNATVATTTTTGGNGSFAFSVSNLSVGTHNLFAVFAGDSTYATSQSSQVTQTVNPPNPAVVSIAVNGDSGDNLAGSNSRVATLYVTFNQAVQLGSGAFSLALHNNVGINGTTGRQVGVVPATLNWSSTDNIHWTITFSGTNGIDVNVGADGHVTIMDGVYDLTVVAAQIHPSGSPTVNMAGNFTQTFWALFGDTGASDTITTGTIGDGNTLIAVGNSDFNTFANAYQATGYNVAAGYNPTLDVDGDGSIGNTDFNTFANNYQTIWTF